MPEQKGRAGLEPETQKLKQKKRRPDAPKRFSQRLFGRRLFLGRGSTAQIFAPVFIWAEGAGPPMEMPMPRFLI
jgi:hypothetical protein